MDIAPLEELGLSYSEIKVFLALLELGPSKAGKILEKSGLHNTVVHRALHSLEEKSFLSYVTERKKKIYQPIDPKQIGYMLEEKKRNFDKFLPQLLSLNKNLKGAPEVKLFRGSRAIRGLLNSLLENSPKEYLSYGGSFPQSQKLEDYFWTQFHVRRIKMKIPAKIIFQPSLRNIGTKILNKGFTELRYYKHEMEPLQETVICDGKVAILIYSDEPYGILIKDPIVSSSYKKYFDIIWKQTIK